MLLNNVAESISKAETATLMRKLAKAMSETAQNLEQYNELLAIAIKDCVMCHEFEELNKKRARKSILIKFCTATSRSWRCTKLL